MKAKIDDYKDEIISRYMAGETALEISKDLPFHNSHISRRLHLWGVSRGRKSKKRCDYSESIKQDFLSGQYYCEDLAKKYNVDVHTIYSILDEAGIERHTGVKSKCNEDYFEKIDNSNKAYLLGFITADGAIVNSRLSIEVHQRDKGLILFAKEQINPQGTITEIHYKTTTLAPNGKEYTSVKNDVRIAFGSKKIGQDLAKYGIVQNKSKILTKVPVDYIPKNLLPFYFRGLIDGDGCIYISKRGYLQVTITSCHRDILDYIREMTKSLYGIDSYVYSENNRKYRIYFNGKNALELLDFLYKNSNENNRLDRKYDIYTQYIDTKGRHAKNIA